MAQFPEIKNNVVEVMNKGMEWIQHKIAPSVTFGTDSKSFIEEKILNAASRGGYTSQFLHSWQEPTRCLIISLE